MSYSKKNVSPYQYNEVAVHGYITVLRRVLVICVVVLLVGARIRRSIGVSNFGIEELSVLLTSARIKQSGNVSTCESRDFDVLRFTSALSLWRALSI